jgi:hypothetical protein
MRENILARVRFQEGRSLAIGFVGEVVVAVVGVGFDQS